MYKTVTPVSYDSPSYAFVSSFANILVISKKHEDIFQYAIDVEVFPFLNHVNIIIVKIEKKNGK